MKCVPRLESQVIVVGSDQTDGTENLLDFVSDIWNRRSRNRRNRFRKNTFRDVRTRSWAGSNGLSDSLGDLKKMLRKINSKLLKGRLINEKILY
jgi:hypothetical protein